MLRVHHSPEAAKIFEVLNTLVQGYNLEVVADVFSDYNALIEKLTGLSSPDPAQECIEHLTNYHEIDPQSILKSLAADITTYGQLALPFVLNTEKIEQTKLMRLGLQIQAAAKKFSPQVGLLFPAVIIQTKEAPRPEWQPPVPL